MFKKLKNARTVSQLKSDTKVLVVYNLPCRFGMWSCSKTGIISRQKQQQKFGKKIPNTFCFDCKYLGTSTRTWRKTAAT